MAGAATTELTAAVQTAKGAGGYGCPERPPLSRHHAELRRNPDGSFEIIDLATLHARRRHRGPSISGFQ